MIATITSESVSKYLAAHSAELHLIEASFEESPGKWSIFFEDDVEVLIELADQPRRLVLTAALGVAAQESELEVLRFLLCYSLLWPDTGGFRVARSLEDGVLLLISDWFEPEVEQWQLDAAIEKFCEVVRWQRTYIANPDLAIDDGAEGVDHNLMDRA